MVITSAGLQLQQYMLLYLVLFNLFWCHLLCAQSTSTSTAYFGISNSTGSYASTANATDKEPKHQPCWCAALSRKIKESTHLLQERYGGKSILNGLSSFSSSGHNNALVERLLHSLNSRKPFRLGVMAGSMALPQPNDFNPWAANVTRWINAILSSSTCDPELDLPVNTTAHCIQRTMPGPQKNESELSFLFREEHRRPLFCMPLSSSVRMKYLNDSRTVVIDTVVPPITHHPHSRDQDDICDNAGHVIQKDCSLVYWGSDKYATLSNAAKSHTQSMHGAMAMSRTLNSKEDLDFLFWDYGVNDVGGGAENHYTFAEEFFTQALHFHRKLSGVGVVYWPLMVARYYCTEKCPLVKEMEDPMSVLHHPILKLLFDPRRTDAPFRNISLLTFSAGRFCNLVGGCVFDDFLAWYTNSHGHDLGHSRFGDFAIWQFLRAFRAVHKRACLHHHHPVGLHHHQQQQPHTGRDGASQHPIPTTAVAELEADWIIDNRPVNNRSAEGMDASLSEPLKHFERLLNYAEHLNREHMRTYLKRDTLSSSAHHSYSANYTAPEDVIREYQAFMKPPLVIEAVAMTPFWTPQLGAPPPVEQVAVLCAPGQPRLESGSDMLSIIPANSNIRENITIQPHWVPLDISILLRENCSGYLNMFGRGNRPDSEQAWSASVSVACPRGGIEHTPDCPQPAWAGQDYPHGIWQYMPFVKSVDLVYRINDSVSWTHVCFGSCVPSAFWRLPPDASTKTTLEFSTTWKSDPNQFKQEQLNKPIWRTMQCFTPKSGRFPKSADGFTYIWYPSDRCYRTTNGTVFWGAVTRGAPIFVNVIRRT